MLNSTLFKIGYRSLVKVHLRRKTNRAKPFLLNKIILMNLEKKRMGRRSKRKNQLNSLPKLMKRMIHGKVLKSRNLNFESLSCWLPMRT